MSKVTQKHDSWMMGKRLDCGHTLFDFGDDEDTFDDRADPYQLGDEVDCPICVEIAEWEKAARREALEEVKLMAENHAAFSLVTAINKLLETK